MTIYFCEGNYFILIILFQHTHQIPLHILVDYTVSGKGAAAFFVAEYRAQFRQVSARDQLEVGEDGRDKLSPTLTLSLLLEEFRMSIM